MTLFKDKYFPISFDDYKFHTKLVPSLNNLVNDNQLFNSVFYGPYGSGKYTIVINLLIKIYGKDILNKKQSIFTITKSCGNSKDYTIFQSNYHFEINLNKYLFNDRISLVNLLNQLIQTKDINTSAYKIIVIRNIHYLNSDIIKFLGSVIEKYVESVRFILITSSNYSRVMHILQGKYFFIKIPSPDRQKILEFSNDIFNENNITISSNNINKIIDNSERNLHKLIIHIQLCCENEKYISYKSPMEIYISEIFKMMKKKTNTSLIKLREYIYNLITKNINIKLFIKHFIKESLNQNLTTNQILEIQKWACIFDERLSYSYKEVVHFEAFIYKICYIIDN